MNVFELFGKIAVDGSGAMSGIDQTVGHAKNAESSLTKTFKKIGTAVAAAFSVRAVVDFGKQCTQAYATIAAEESAFAQIMGEYADTAQLKMNAVADQTGITSTRLTGAMTSLTAKFKGLGYNVEDATTLATDGLLIAADAAAFWDMSLDESMSHLNSFINGSYEGGEAIGLFANDTQMAAYAIEQGIVKDAKAWAKLDEAQKQATRLDYAKQMMESSGATGQAAKEADAYANVMANLKESWRQFQGVIGKPILEKLVLPAMQKLNAFMPKLNEAVQNGITWLEEGFGKIKGYFEDVFTEDGINLDALPDALTKMFRDLGSSAGKLLRSFGQTLKNGWSNTVWPAIQGVAAKIGIELPGWTEIETKIKTWWENGGIAGEIAKICNWTLNLFGAPADVTAEDVTNILDAWWSKTVKFVQDACSWVLKLFSNPTEAAEDVKDAISSWWSGVVGAVQDACSWVLNVFQNPPDITAEEVASILDAWWNKTVKFVEDACSWVLNLFGAPEDVTAEGVGEIVSGWWNKTVKFVQDACSWVLNVFQNPPDITAEEVASILGTWWSKTVKFVQDACSWVLNLFGAPEDVTAEGIGEIIGGWWEKAVKFVQDACSWTLQLFTNPTDDQKQIIDAIKGWWEAGRAVVEGFCTWTLSLFDTPDLKDAVDKLKAWWDSVLLEVGDYFKITFGLPDESGAGVTTNEDGTTHGGGGMKFGMPAEGTGGTGGTGGGNDGWNPSLRPLYRYPDLDIDGTGGSNGLSGLITALQALPAQIESAVKAGSSAGTAEGVGGITVTGSISTGSVMLDTGVLAGQLAPRLDLKLGSKFSRVSV